MRRLICYLNLIKEKLVNKVLRALSLKTIRLFRKILLHTPVNNWPVTGHIKSAVFRAAYRTPEVTIHYKGADLIVPTSDAALVPGLAGGYYESYELDLYMALSKVSSTIIDVGGNIGLYAVLGAAQMSKSARLITFEPIESNVELLRRNVALNRLADKVLVNQTAIGSETEDIEIFVSENNVGNHSFAKKNAGKASKPVKVQQTTIDNYVKKNKITGVDLLKIDIEGYDGFALEGAQRTLNEYTPTLFVEYIPHSLENCGYLPEKFINLLSGIYKNCYVIDEIDNSVQYIKGSDLLKVLPTVKSANLLLSNKNEHLKIIKAQS